MKAPAADESPDATGGLHPKCESEGEKLEMSQQIGGNPYATRNKVPPDSDDSGNGGDARGMLYHAKGGMRSICCN